MKLSSQEIKAIRKGLGLTQVEFAEKYFEIMGEE